MNWGKWIVVSFLLFVAFIGTLVVVCVRQDISLVTKDYYQDELAYQDQLDRLNNTNGLVQKPSIEVMADDYLRISFAQFSEMEKGKLQLFCPSNAKLDKHFSVGASIENQQYFTINNLPKGMYRARLQWTMKGKEFYLEEIIYL